jgi:hypothetical protein|tara:strand:- start:665 stop:829 length:165 start_codon:yes stop_codon:yes gene_type:complete
MISKVTIQEVGRFEKTRQKAYEDLRRFNIKLLDKLEEKGFDKYSFPFVITERSR